MKKMTALLIMILLLASIFSYGGATERQNISNDYYDERCAIFFLPDLTGQGSEWVCKRWDEEIVRVSITAVPTGRVSDPKDNRCMYRLQMDGVAPGFCYVTAELIKDTTLSWRYNFFVEVDEANNVMIRYADLQNGQGDVTDVMVNYGESEHFTREQMDEAITVILNDFREMSGFVLHSVSYVSDERSKERYELYAIRYNSQDELGRDYVDGIYFLSDFSTLMADDGWTGFESNQFIKNLGWTLLLTVDGEWDIITSGY